MTSKIQPPSSLAFCVRAAVAIVAACLPFSAAHAEKKLTSAVTLSSKEHVSVVLDREQATDGTYVVLKIVVPQDVKIDAFMLPDPPRIVLDMAGASVKHSETFNAPANDVVKAVRLGSHPGKLRVVVDLAKAEAPKYEWKAGKRQVILRMLEKAAAVVQEPPAPQAPQAKQEPAVPAKLETESLGAGEPPAASLPKDSKPVAPALPAETEEKVESLGKAEEQAQQPAPEAKLEQKPQEQVAALPQKEEPAQPPAVEQPKQQAAAQPPAEQPGSLGAAAAAAVAPPADKNLPAQGNIKIVGYRFEYGEPGKTPILKVTLNSNGATAQISKVDSTTYKIVVPKSALANEDLVLPQFPPADFVGFIMVMSEEVSDSVEITVSVEEGVTLNTMVKGDEIWALASSGS